MTPPEPTVHGVLDEPLVPDPDDLFKRRFLGRSRPLLGLAAQLLLREAAVRTDRWIDLRGLLVALPGARAGRRLAELLLEGAEAEGLALLPPEITTTGELPERFYRSALPEPHPVVDGAAWRAALEGLRTEERERLSGVPPEPDDDTSWARLARTVGRLHRDVAAGGWSFHQVAERCDADGLLFNDEERWRLLAKVQDAYREILAAHGLRDREDARRRALAGREAALDRPLWLVGIVDFPPVVRRFLEEGRRVAPHRVLIPAPEEEAAGFDQLGSVVPAWWADREPEVPAGAVRVVAGPADQAAATVDFLADLGGRFAPEAIGVGVPDPEVRPFLVERLEGAGAPVRWAGGRAMHRTGLFRLMEALASYLDGREYEAFARLVRHPEADRALRREGRLSGVASLPALADRFHEHHLPARLEKGRLPSGGERGGAAVQAALTEARDALDRLLAPLEGSHPLSEWPGPLQEVLVRLLGNPELERSRPEDHETLHFASGLRDVLQGMQAVPPGLDRPVPAHRAIRTVLQELRERAVPAEANRGAVELLGWLELALDDTPVVVVTGVNEPRLPEAVTAHPFLPHALRSRLGLLDNRGRWARDLLHMRMILEGREHALLVAGRFDAEGNPLRLSRLLLTGAPEEVARRILAFLDPAAEGGESRTEEEAGGRAGSAPADAEGALGRAEELPGLDGAEAGGDRDGPGAPAFRLPPQPVLAAEAPPDQIRVTRFKRVLTDPYLWALDEVLGLEAADDDAREMDGALFGTLAHEVLEHWGRGDQVDAAEAPRIRRALEDALDRISREWFGARPLPAVRLQIEQLRTRLGAFAEWQARWRADGWEIRAVEAAPEAPGVPFDVDGVPIRLRGRIDRVDHRPRTGEWLLLDYKTGDQVSNPDRTHRKGWGSARRWVDLQLPLYLRLAPALRSDDGAPLIPRKELPEVGVGYVALPRERKKVCEHLAAWGEQELAEAEKTARDVVRLLRGNRFEFRPGVTRAHRGSPLAPLLGAGVMVLDEENGPGGTER